MLHDVLAVAADRVRALRLERDESQAAFARRAGVSPRTVLQVENRKPIRSIVDYVAMATALGLTFEQLFAGTPLQPTQRKRPRRAARLVEQLVELVEAFEPADQKRVLGFARLLRGVREGGPKTSRSKRSPPRPKRRS